MLLCARSAERRLSYSREELFLDLDFFREVCVVTCYFQFNAICARNQSGVCRARTMVKLRVVLFREESRADPEAKLM